MLALEFITNEKEDKHVNNLFKISQQEFLQHTQNLHFGFAIKHEHTHTKDRQQIVVEGGEEWGEVGEDNEK